MATAPSRLLLKSASIEESAPDSDSYLACLVKPIHGQPGYVFGVLDIRNHSPQAEMIGEIILEQLDRTAATVQTGINLQHRFEQVLEAINEQIANVSAELDQAMSPDIVHALVGVASDNTMYLSGTGELTALFLHHMPEDRYQVFNLFRSIQTEQAKPKWQKLFAVVLDGDLHAGDIFCVSNRALQQEIPADELNHVLATLPPQSATAKLRQYFPEQADLVLFVLKAQMADAQTTPAKPAARESADASIQQLGQSQEKTKRLLADQQPNMRGSAAKMAGSLLVEYGPKAKQWAKTAGRILAGWGVIAAGWAWKGLQALQRFLKSLTGPRRKEVLTGARRRVDQGVSSLVGRFNRLPKTSKYLALGFISLAFVVAGSVMFLSRSHAQQAQVAAYETQAEAVEKLRDRVNGALIYKDENQARTLLAEATTALAALPTDTPDEQARADKIRADLGTAADQLRHVVNVPQPPMLADTTSLGADVTAQALALDQGTLYLLASDKNAYRVNMTTKTLEKVATGDAVGVAKEASPDSGTITYIDDLGLSQFNEKAATLTASDAKPGANERWTDLYAYGGHVYVLSPGGAGSKTQILKFTPTTTAFGAGSDWIKADTTDLSDAIGIAVDGTVFVLKQNGTIVRFTSGAEVSWKQGAVDPALTAPSDIWTSDKSSYLYVLEPSTQRLVVYDKEKGTFLTQYRSDAFVGLTDFAVDEANKAIYLLASGKVYKIDATHITK